MKNKSTCVTALFLSLLLTNSLFASKNTLEFEIVPFDYADGNMKEQICAMVRDDQDIQNMTHQTEESMKELLSKKPQEGWSLFVCRSIDDSSTIYAYMNYARIEIADHWELPAKGQGFYFHLKTSSFYRTTLDEAMIAEIPSAKVLQTINSVGYLDGFAVHKNYRGKGIAQAMLNYFEEDCRNCGTQQLMLFVDANNENGIRAYGKSGFKINLAYNDNVENYTMIKLIP
ncbi:GNAT family N-acetyltransferase [Candidatus Babeliales bacterium]|nr:GNAT family N-acetyltransferase [Candidatus Babeliales bacterium]MBP9843505.1 GNAT family N-acetyltransferase [Candidatus Babeliales bacterium]